MMYPFMQLNDGTEIVHSEMLPEGKVRVYIETPDEKDCFHSAECFLPGYEWKNISGYGERGIQYFQSIIESTAHLIIEFSQHGGLENASGF